MTEVATTRMNGEKIRGSTDGTLDKDGRIKFVTKYATLWLNPSTVDRPFKDKKREPYVG